MSTPHIHYIEGSKIDRKKWDDCILRAGNGLIYAQSFYLDSMAKSWDGLILNDYETVMPLPVRKKWGFDYIFQPFLTPTLGVFGNKISEDTITMFLENIPGKFRLWDISLNHFNTINKKFQQQYGRSNFILPLSPSYETIKSNYSENIFRNISKAEKSGCVLKKNISVTDIIEVCKKEWPKFTGIEKGTFENIEKNFSLFHAYAVTYGVYSPEEKLLCGCAFLIDNKRAYYWLVGNEPASKEVGASPMLIDGFIRDNAGNKILLDFEGSDKKGVAAFYQRFGAIPEPYTTIYNNRLPFPVNLLKKTPAHYRTLTS